jgi:transposase InsO family protein
MGEEVPMPWNETDVMQERMKFVCECLEGDEAMAGLCRAYGISRKTGYRWLDRYRTDGICGLLDRSSAPHRHPQAVPEELVALIVSVRRRHRTWGPRKVRAWLAAHYPGVSWPAASTIGTLFDRAGLTVPRPRRRRTPAPAAPLAHARAANDVWTIDFKGWFRTGDGKRCDPLTLQDAASRYLLRCRVLERLSCEQVWPQLDVAFRAYGLPGAVRSDNGEPFASVAIGGLSRLAVKLIKAGVMPERIAPGKPQQNGRHERLHLTLQQETASPPASNGIAQQRRFDAFARIYNEDRPHEALDQSPPARHYEPSPRVYRGRLRSPEYDDRHQVRKVRGSGEVKWHGKTIFISTVLIGEPVGLVELEDGRWRLSYGPLQLGVIDDKGRVHKPTRPVPENLDTP